MAETSNRPTLTVISRVGCHLCVDAERIVHRVSTELGLPMRRVDVDHDESLAQYTDLVPVVLIDDQLHQHWRIEEERLRAALAPPGRRRWWRRG